MKDKIGEQLASTPFIPHPALKNPHAQTIMGTLIPRRFKLVQQNSEPRIFDVAPGIRVLGLCSWQEDRTRKPTLLIVHGMEGSVGSRYMLGTADKALAAGFNAIRMNMRNCGGTAHLTPTLYHAGLTDDLRQILRELIEQDGLKEIYLAGFSLGGNVALKLAGEYGPAAPKELRGVVAISPSLDLASCADAIEMRSNLIYHLRFTLSLRASLKQKASLYPEKYNTNKLRGIWSIRKFDDTYTAPAAGFRDVNDYYRRASALPLVGNIRVPALIIHAKDDPFIPFAPFRQPEITENPNVTLMATEHGGHVGFISAHAEGESRFWSEVTAIRFAELLHSKE
ncbi:MAG TPA: alpha/beta fold hydrolase [Blastocatellia bacterium]|nr:alpha/beta fold hydrolase [Blastocatellia bacterium]